MNTFLAGTAVTRKIQLVLNGAAVVADSVAVSVKDAAGVEVIDQFAATPVEGCVTVTVPEFGNVVSDGVRDGRSITLRCVTASGEVIITDSYVIEKEVLFSVPSNSFITLMQCDLEALSLTGMSAWETADQAARVAALAEAYQCLCRLKFTPFKRGRLSQDRMYSDMGSLTSSEFLSLPDDFRKAIARAQLVEAVVLLEGGENPNADAGLVSEAVGEVKQTFRQTKPLDLPVSRRALKHLNGFVAFTGIVAR